MEKADRMAEYTIRRREIDKNIDVLQQRLAQLERYRHNYIQCTQMIANMREFIFSHPQHGVSRSFTGPNNCLDMDELISNASKTLFIRITNQSTTNGEITMTIKVDQ